MDTSELKVKVADTWKLGDDAIKNPQKYNGFLGISLTSLLYNNQNIKSYLKFANHYFIRVALLPVDLPYRYNYMVFEDLSEVQANQKATVLGNQLKKSLVGIIKNLNLESKVSILTWKEIINEAECKHILSSLEYLLGNSTEFLSDVHLHLQEQAPFIKNKLFNLKHKLSDEDFRQKNKMFFLFKFLVIP